MRRAIGPLAPLALALLAGACGGPRNYPFASTQRWPSPMAHADAEVLGALPGERVGPEEVHVLRHADPVQVRPAGLASSFPLSFHQKSLRVFSGSGVYSAPGGRVEILWPGGNSLLLMGRTAGIVGSPSRGEPAFRFQEIERADIEFRSPDQIELLGGARLAIASGPFLVEKTRSGILRVRNQSKSTGSLAFRDAVIALDPGQAVDLPLLEAGGRPQASDPGTLAVRGLGFPMAYSGRVELVPEGTAVRARPIGEHEIRALGVALRLPQGEEARLDGFSTVPAEPRSEVPAEPSGADPRSRPDAGRDGR